MRVEAAELVHEPAPLDHAAVRSIVIGILLAMLLAALDQTIVATALPTIGRELGDPENLPWVVTAYLLSSTAVTPLYGKLSDIHGRRLILLIGIGTFVLGSLACALAPSMTALIVARALQGLGGGGLISLAQTIIADVVAPKERGRYQGYIAGVFVTSSVAGPVLGGFFAEHLHWSMIFWINLPLGLARVPDDQPRAAPAAAPRAPASARSARRRADGARDRHAAAGAQLGRPALSLGLGAGGRPAARLGRWCRCCSCSASGRRSSRSCRSPVILNPVVAAGTATACCAMGVFIGLSVYVPIYLQSVLRLSASASGLAMIALMGGTVTGATVSGRVMMHVRHYRRLPVAGLIVATLAVLALALRPSGLPLGLVEVLLAAIGLGLGTVLPVTTVAIQNAVELHQLGTATASMNFFRSLGGAILVAAFGAILLGGIGAAGLDGPAYRPDRGRHHTAGSGRRVRLAVRGRGAWPRGRGRCLLTMAERPLRGRISGPPPAREPGRAPLEARAELIATPWAAALVPAGPWPPGRG